MKKKHKKIKNQIANNGLVIFNMFSIRNLVLLIVLLWSGFIRGQDINTIPEASLYFFYNYQITEKGKSVGLTYPEETKIDYKNYYLKNESEPYFSGHYNSEKYSSSQIDSIEKSLKNHITLELVDDHIVKKRIFNPFQLSATNDDPVKIKEDGSFYLPIKNNTDSIFYEASKPIEAYMQDFHYVGEIKSLNKYVVYSFFELPEYLLIDKLTGVITSISSGFPNYSPNQQYLIDLVANTATYQNNESAELRVAFFDKSNKVIKTLRVNFKTWAPSSYPTNFFWTSNNELIFKAYPIRKYVGTGNENDLKYQYIKLTLK